MALFERQGFDKTTIEAITAEAGLAPRTFFSYFATKDDLVLGDYADRLSRILTEFDQRPVDEGPWTALQAAFAAVASDYESEGDRIRQRFLIMTDNPSVFARSLQLQAGWEQALTEHLRIRLGAKANDARPRLLAATALAVMRSSLQHWLSTPRTPALPKLVEQAFGQLATGWGPDSTD